MAQRTGWAGTRPPFSYRDANFAQAIVGFSFDPADADVLKSCTDAYWEALHPYSLGGAYVNS